MRLQICQEELCKYTYRQFHNPRFGSSRNSRENEGARGATDEEVPRLTRLQLSSGTHAALAVDDGENLPTQ